MHSGDLERTRRFWFYGTCNQQDEENNANSHQFGLLQSSSVFFMLAIGICLGVIIHIIKYIVNKYFGSKISKIWMFDSKFDYQSAKNSQEKIRTNILVGFSYHLLKKKC